MAETKNVLKVILKNRAGEQLAPVISVATNVNVNNSDPITSLALINYLKSQNLSGCLPLSGGGKMTGSFVGRSVEDSYFTVGGGTSDSSGAYLRVFGTDHPEVPGDFQLVANDGTNKIFLTGKANGNLYWNGKVVTLTGDCLSVSGGRMIGPINGNASTFTLSLNGGSGSSDGAYLRLYSKDHGSLGGYVTITAAKSADTFVQLIMRPDGVISWGGKSFLLVEDSGSYYIRFTNGLQICWGFANSFTHGAAKSISFPQSFKSAPVVTNSVAYFLEFSGISNVTSTGFEATINGGTGDTFWWMAIGKWK